MKWKSIRKKRCRETLPSGERASAELRAWFLELTERAGGSPTLPVFLLKHSRGSPSPPKRAFFPVILVYH